MSYIKRPGTEKQEGGQGKYGLSAGIPENKTGKK